MRRALMWRLQGVAAWVMQRSASLPIDKSSNIGAWLFGRIGPHLRSSRKIAANMQRAFPEKSPAEIAGLVRGAWRNLGRVVAEFPHLDRLDTSGSQPRIEVVGAENIVRYRQAGQPCIFITAHLANWELAALTLIRLGLPLTAVFAPLANPSLDKRLAQERERLGCELVPKGLAGTRRLVQALREGRSLGMVMDRKRLDGILAPFFGQDAWTTTTPARLSIKFDCPVLPIRIERLGAAWFRATIYAPLKAQADTPDGRVVELTHAANRTIEQWIRERPDQWWCDTNRWGKTKRGRPAGNKSHTSDVSSFMTQVRDNPGKNRFELEVDGHIAFADYRRRGSTVIIPHVEAALPLRGTGAAGQLMRGVMEHARSEGLKVVPLCGYASAWLRRHKEYADLVG